MRNRSHFAAEAHEPPVPDIDPERGVATQRVIDITRNRADLMTFADVLWRLEVMVPVMPPRRHEFAGRCCGMRLGEQTCPCGICRRMNPARPEEDPARDRRRVRP